MSTSFYWITNVPEDIIIKATGEKIEVSIDHMDPTIHIGKSSAGFTWAQDPVKVELICEKFPDEEIIVDEYGEKYTGNRFQETIKDLDSYKYMIGQWFG